jgi:hypothetical protein
MARNKSENAIPKGTMPAISQNTEVVGAKKLHDLILELNIENLKGSLYKVGKKNSSL